MFALVRFGSIWSHALNDPQRMKALLDGFRTFNSGPEEDTFERTSAPPQE